MSKTGLAVFDETVHKTNGWLKESAKRWTTDIGRITTLPAVLHCLRDRLSVDEASYLGDQWPMLVRGVCHQAWRPSGKPEKIGSREEFLVRIAADLANEPIGPEEAACAVFQVLEKHIAPSEVLHVTGELPNDVSAAVTTVARLTACASRSHPAWTWDWIDSSLIGDPSWP